MKKINSVLGNLLSNAKDFYIIYRDNWIQTEKLFALTKDICEVYYVCE